MMNESIAVVTDEQMAITLAESLTETGGTPVEVREEATHDAEHEPTTLYVLQAEGKVAPLLAARLEEMRSEEPEGEGEFITCPECESTHLDFPLRAESSATLQALEKAIDAVTEAVAGGTKAFVCKSCGETWQIRELDSGSET